MKDILIDIYWNPCRNYAILCFIIALAAKIYGSNELTWSETFFMFPTIWVGMIVLATFTAGGAMLIREIIDGLD